MACEILPVLLSTYCEIAIALGYHSSANPCISFQLYAFMSCVLTLALAHQKCIIHVLRCITLADNMHAGYFCNSSLCCYCCFAVHLREAELANAEEQLKKVTSSTEAKIDK